MPNRDKKPTYQQARQAVNTYIKETLNQAEKEGLDEYAYLAGTFSGIAANLLAGNPTVLNKYITDLPSASSSRP